MIYNPPPAGGSPASPNTSVQFNNSGAFGGSSNLTFTGGNTLNVANVIQNDTSAGLIIQPTLNNGVTSRPLYFGTSTFGAPFGPMVTFFGTSGNNNAFAVLSGTSSSYGGFLVKPGFRSVHGTDDTAEMQGSDSGLHVVAPLAFNPEGGEVGLATDATASHTVTLGGSVATTSGTVLEDGSGNTNIAGTLTAPVVSSGNGFTGSGAFTNFTIVNGIVTDAF